MTNVLRSKGNQAMKFGQFIEYNMRNIFIEKPYTKCDGNPILIPFSKHQKWAFLFINILKVYRAFSYCMPSWGLSKDIENKLQTACFYLIWSFFKKTRIGMEPVSLPLFLYDLWSKMFLLLYSITRPNFIVWLSLLRYRAIYVL